MNGKETLITTDVVAELTEEETSRYGIRVAKAAITWEGKDLDNNMAPEKLVKTLNSNPNKYPQTAAMGEGVFRQLWQGHGGPVISIHPPRGFSRLIEDAQITARKMDPEGKRIYVIPGLVSIAQGWLAMAAAEMAEDNVPAAEIAKECVRKNSDYRVLAALNSVDYLRAGGRYSYTIRASLKETALMLASRLRLKPVVEITPEGIKVHEARIKKRSESLEKLKAAVWNLRENKIITKAVVAHSLEDTQKAEELAEELKIATGLTAIGLKHLGLFTTCHAGPETLAICAEVKNY